MNVVRICFQASYRDQQGQMRQMDPVLSEPVYDKSESGFCVHRLSLAAGTRKPHVQRHKLIVNPLFLYVSLVKSVPVDSAAQQYRGTGSPALCFSLFFPHSHELAATAPDITSIFKA